MIWFLKTALGLASFAWAIWMVIRMVRDEDDKDERTSWAVFFLVSIVLAVPIYFFTRYLPRRWRESDLREQQAKSQRS